MVHLRPPVSELHTLAALLRHDGAGTPLPDHLRALARMHGVDAVLGRGPAGTSADPKPLIAGREAIVALRDQELRSVVTALGATGTRPVVIKGAHLGHVLYASPALRPRADTDIVIAADEIDVAASALEAIGYTRAVHVRGSVMLGQCHFRRIDNFGFEHALDLHWRLASPLVFRHVLPAAVLREHAVAIPALGPHAWGPALPHALVIGCVHLVAHHRADAILLWYYELAALVRALDEDGLATFIQVVNEARIATVCAAALALAHAYFDDPRLHALMIRMRALTRGREYEEPSARLLSASRPVDELWLDLRMSSGWRERVTLMKEHLWPDADYMRATASDTWLPAAYARRAVRGALRWTRTS